MDFCLVPQDLAAKLNYFGMKIEKKNMTPTSQNLHNFTVKFLEHGDLSEI